MGKYPYQMTSSEFAQSFPFFSELLSKVKWRLSLYGLDDCYKIRIKKGDK